MLGPADSPSNRRLAASRHCVAMANLSLANVMHRKTRTVVVVLAVAVEVATVMLLVGMADGTLNAIARRLESVGADALLQPPDSSLILGVSSAVLPLRLIAKVEEIPGVTAVAPVLNWQVTRVGQRATSLNLWAVDPDRFDRLGGGLDLAAGRALRDRGDLVVDTLLAEEHGLELGQALTLLEREFRVVGLSRPGSGGRLYARLDDVGDATGNPGKSSFFLIKGTSAREAGALVRALQARLPGYKVTAVAQVSHAIQRNAVGLREFQGALTSLAVVVSFLVVLLAMYTAILERTREIGILRALGATQPTVVALIVSEGALLCAFGGLVGVGLAFAGRHLLQVVFPAQDVDFTLGWTIAAAGLGLGGGLVGSVYPAWRAARLDPVVALASE